MARIKEPTPPNVGALALDAWSAFTETFTVKHFPEVGIALATGRTQLLKFAGVERTPQEMELLEVIRVLMDTNAALREHAEGLSNDARRIREQFKGLSRHILRLELTADFKQGDDDSDG